MTDDMSIVKYRLVIQADGKTFKDKHLYQRVSLRYLRKIARILSQVTSIGAFVEPVVCKPGPQDPPHQLSMADWKHKRKHE